MAESNIGADVNSKSGDNQSGDLIVIDSDEEDVIFVNEDGVETLAQSEIFNPDYVADPRKSKEPGVRRIFDEIVKLQDSGDKVHAVIEGSINVPTDSPSDEYDDEQTEFPNYNVQVMNKTSHSETDLKCEPVDGVSETASSAPVTPSKPIIKLAPLSKLMSVPLVPPETTITLNTPEDVNMKQLNKPGESSRPQIKSRVIYKDLNKPVPPGRSNPSKSSLTQSKKSISPKKSPKVNLSPNKNDLSPLLEKRAILLKLIPGVTFVSNWTWENALKRAVNFIMELRKSDCELDIAEEALMQSNIKLTMDYDRLLAKVYRLCSGSDKDTPLLRKTSSSVTNESDHENVCSTETSIKTDDNPKQEETSKSPNKESSGEELNLLHNLLGDVKESAKSHLLNFDPDIPYKEFLPPPLLNWDRPKSKSDILEELMLLENAISKCSSESQEITKVSHGQNMFHYEDLMAVFKKEFDLDVKSSEIKTEELKLDDEVGHDQDNKIVGDVKNEDIVSKVETSEVESKKRIKSGKKESPKKGSKKRTPWNKGLKGCNKQPNLAAVKSSEVALDESVSDLNSSIATEISEMHSDNEQQKVANEMENQENSESEKPLVSRIESIVKIAKTKRRHKKVKKVKKKTQTKKPQALPVRVLPKRKKVETSKEMSDENCESKNDETDVKDSDEEVPTPKLVTSVFKLFRERSVKKSKIVEADVPCDDVKVSAEPIVDKKRGKRIAPVKESNSSSPDIEPVRSRRSQRMKYTEGARTTRSFVKKCFEVMDQVDKEMEVFLQKDVKKTDQWSDECSDEEENNDDDPDKCNQEKDPDECSEEKDPDKCSEEKDPDKCSEEKEPDKYSEEKNPVEIIENYKEDIFDKEEPCVQEIEIVKKISPKKGKKKYYGRSKRRRRINRVKKVNLVEGNVSMAVETLNAPDFDSADNISINSMNTSLPNENETVNIAGNSENVGNSNIISNCFSIDPSLFDNMGGNVNETPVDEPPDDEFPVDETPVDETPENEVVSSPKKTTKTQISPEKVDTCEVKHLNTPPTLSPVKLLKVDEAPLDFSVKNTPPIISPVKTIQNIESQQPLNLSGKVESTQMFTDEVIDFSVKSKPVVLNDSSTSKETDKTDEPIPFNLSKSRTEDTDLSSNLINISGGVVSHNDTPKTPFSTGKQIYSDPKDFNVNVGKSTANLSGPVLNSSPSVSPAQNSTPEPCALSLTSLSSLEPSSKSVDSPIPAVSSTTVPLPAGSSPQKDSIINEITDILVDLADQPNQSSLNFEIEETSASKEPNSVSLSQARETSAVILPPEASVSSTVNVVESPNLCTSFNNDISKSSSLTPTSTSISSQMFSPSMGSQNVPSLQNIQMQNYQTFSSTLPSGIPGQCIPSYAQGNIMTPNIMPTQFVNVPQNFNHMNMALGNSQLQNFSNTSVMPTGMMANQLQALQMQQAAYQAMTLQQAQLINLQRTELSQNQNLIVPYDPRVAAKVENITEPNVNDPRIQRRLSQSMDSSNDSEKQLVPLLNQTINWRDPRLARKLIESTSSVNSDSPFSGNLQINQLISEVIKQNNFENFLMDSKTNQMIMNQSLEIDEDDLNLNRSDIDEFNSSDETENEEKQRQNLLRKSIDKLIVSDLQGEGSPVSTSSAKTNEPRKPNNKPDKEIDDLSESSEESCDESRFTRSRMIRSPPMIKKNKAIEGEYGEPASPKKSPVKSSRKTNPDHSSSDIELTGSKRSSRKNIKYTEDDSEPDSESSNEELKEASPKRKLSVTEYLGRKRDKAKSKLQKLDDDNKKKYSDDEYSPIMSAKKRASKRIIESDDESPACRKLFHDDEVPNDDDETQYDDSDEKYDVEKTELPEEITDHLKRVSNIKQRKFEGKEKKIVQSKKEPQLRRMKFLDNLPDSDVNKSVVPVSKHNSEKSFPRSDKHNDSLNSTSRVVRKTITTERIVTKRVGSDSSSTTKKLKYPEKEKKVFVEERITLKVNEKSNLQRKGGINFKCGALKEGEILKVVGGKLVRVRKRVSNSDDEIEKERSKLHKCLNSLKIKKKADANSPVDDNPYSVLREDNIKSSISDRPKYNDHGHGKSQNQAIDRSKILNKSNESVSSDETKDKDILSKIRSPVEISRSNSFDSSDSDVKQSPVTPRNLGSHVSRLRESDLTGRSPRLSSPNKTSPRISSSPNVCSSPSSFVQSDEMALVRRPSMDMARRESTSSEKMSRWDVKQVGRRDSSDNSSPVYSTDVGRRLSNVIANKCGETRSGDIPTTEVKSSRWDMRFAMKDNMEAAKNSDLGMSQMENNIFTRRSNIEVVKKPDMELSRKSDMEVSQGIDSESARRCDYEIARTSELQVARKSNMEVCRNFDGETVSESNVELEESSDNIFTRRESITTFERRMSRDGNSSVGSGEFQRHSVEKRQEIVRTQWTEVSHKKDRDERSILGMMQRGEIKITEPSNGRQMWNMSSRSDVDWRAQGHSRNPRMERSYSWRNDQGDYDARRGWRDRSLHSRDERLDDRSSQGPSRDRLPWRNDEDYDERREWRERLNRSDWMDRQQDERLHPPYSRDDGSQLSHDDRLYHNDGRERPPPLFPPTRDERERMFQRPDDLFDQRQSDWDSEHRLQGRGHFSRDPRELKRFPERDSYQRGQEQCRSLQSRDPRLLPLLGSSIPPSSNRLSFQPARKSWL